ncbi:MAG TPA: TspO/MBR family protein [Candidatus Paceibacterota bacterium]|nr:TspO/MBR family protein [Candidatus Paceibacterota bacterium]
MELDYLPFYESIIKPSFAPEPWVFGLAWGIIYPLILAALIYLCILVHRHRAPKRLLWVFIGNIIANLLFTPVQLGLPSLWPASLLLLFILATLIYVEWYAWQYSKVVFALLVPYLLWGTFATILQLSILFLNT